MNFVQVLRSPINLLNFLTHFRVFFQNLIFVSKFNLCLKIPFLPENFIFFSEFHFFCQNFIFIKISFKMIARPALAKWLPVVFFTRPYIRPCTL